MKKNSNNNLSSVIKFIISSFLSFIIDYTLFTTFSLFYENIIICNVLSRIISANCNYLMNRNYVFKSKEIFYKSFASYAFLALAILTFNTVILHFFVNKLFINRYLAKVIVEGISFIISYIIQKNIIFKQEGKNAKV